MIKWLEEYIDYITFPILLFALFYVDWDHLRGDPVGWLSMFFVGWLAWTFAEYWIHRSFLHGIYWHGIHQLHHIRPKMMTRFPLWQMPTYFAVIYALVWAVAGGWNVAAYAGVILGWIMFFTMHTALHHFPQLLPRFAIRHNRHHKVTDMNYGITVDWWDRLFGTYRQ